MVNIQLEGISIYADAENTLKDMFNPRSNFYAVAVAWDCSGKTYHFRGNLALQLSYNDTRRYQGNAMSLFDGEQVSIGLNLTVFAYHYEGNNQEHKKMLKQLHDGVRTILTRKNDLSEYGSKRDMRIYQQETSKDIKLCVEQFLEREALSVTNIFEGTLDISDIKPNRNLSIINHYRKTGGIKLSVKT